MSLSNQRAIVIDDADSQVRYTGQGWFKDTGSQDSVGNFGPAYQHTLHGTKSNGSFSFGFNGTSIKIFGTNNLLNTSGVIDPQWECFVDKISIGATKLFAFPENNWSLCDREELNDGPHEITVNVTTNGQTFWFDSLWYTPSPGVSFDTAVVLVEHSDPGLVFDSKWGKLGLTAIHMAHLMGSQATFNFTGTSLSWVGIIPTDFPHNASSAVFEIDGGPPSTFHLNGIPPGVTATLYNQVFFTTPELPAGFHTIVVQYTGGSDQTPLTLDYILVTNTSTSISNTPTTPNQHAPTPPTPNEHAHTQSSTQPIGSIIGGVIGGLSIIAFGLGLLWWYRHIQYITKHRSQRASSMAMSPLFTPGSPETTSSFIQTAPMSRNDSTSFSAPLSGYNIETRTQTWAMRKADVALEPVRRVS